MKKTTLAIILLLASSASKSMAQSFKERIHFEASVGSGFESKDITPLDLSYKIGVDIIPSLYAFIATEGNKAFYDDGSVKTYFSGESIGGGLGFKFLKSEKNYRALDLRVKALSSIGNADWKRTTYDASLAFYLQKDKMHIFTPVIEMGYRYIDSRTKGMSNNGNFYMSLGIRF